MKQKRIAILPAYQAEHTLVPFLKSLPVGLFDEIILVDDASKDGTFDLAKKQSGISVYRTPRNLGYGGNLKVCLTLALSHGADAIVELHPDGEYGTDGIIPAFGEIGRGASLVLGNRFSVGKPYGMDVSKYLLTRPLSMLGSIVLGTHIPDMHQGFRVYTRKLLETIDWRATHDDYLFSFEIIVMAIRAVLKVVSIPVTAQYRGDKRGATWPHTIRYTLGIVGHMLTMPFWRNRVGIGTPPPCPICEMEALVETKHHSGRFTVYDCHICGNGFTAPHPKRLASYYPAVYHEDTRFFGRIKDAVFRLAQRRRVNVVRRFLHGGRILDVGSGGGRFGQSLSGSAFVVLGIDPYYAGSNPSVERSDFLSRKETGSYDALVFWESLEHVPNPEAFVTKAFSVLKPGGLLFIEYPRYGSWEPVVFGRYWFHLDVPRHLSHFRDEGLRRLVGRHGCSVIEQRQIFAAEYAPMGLLFSVLRAMGIESYWRWFLPALIFTVPASVLLWMFGQSPIGLLVARKAGTIRTRV